MKVKCISLEEKKVKCWAHNFTVDKVYEAIENHETTFPCTPSSALMFVIGNNDLSYYCDKNCFEQVNDDAFLDGSGINLNQFLAIKISKCLAQPFTASEVLALINEIEEVINQCTYIYLQSSKIQFIRSTKIKDEFVTLDDEDIYRTLNENEEKEFRQWARENYQVGEEINLVWHPIVREECEKMNKECRK